VKDYGNQAPPDPLWRVAKKTWYLRDPRQPWPCIFYIDDYRYRVEEVEIAQGLSYATAVLTRDNANQEPPPRGAVKVMASVCRRGVSMPVRLKGPTGLCVVCKKRAEDLTWFRQKWHCRECLCPPYKFKFNLMRSNWMRTNGNTKEVWRAMNSDWLMEAAEKAQSVVDALPLNLREPQRERMKDILVMEILGDKHNLAIKTPRRELREARVRAQHRMGEEMANR